MQMFMRIRSMVLAIVVGVVATAASQVLMALPSVEAQGVSAQLLANYLGRTGLTWKRDDKDRNLFRVTKTSGLKRAGKVEIVVTNIPNKNLVTLRAFPQVDGKYLGLLGATNQLGLMKEMLTQNATAFGAFFVDEDSDIGFRYVFTTESGLAYTAFKTVLDELLRIADDFIVSLYQKYR